MSIVIRIFEGLFSFIVVALFIFFIWAKVKKKKPLDLYNETADKIMGIETADVNISNPFKGLKKLNIRTIR